jgi:hypothetical protein
MGGWGGGGGRGSVDRFQGQKQLFDRPRSTIKREYKVYGIAGD